MRNLLGCMAAANEKKRRAGERCEIDNKRKRAPLPTPRAGRKKEAHGLGTAHRAKKKKKKKEDGARGTVLSGLLRVAGGGGGKISKEKQQPPEDE